MYGKYTGINCVPLIEQRPCIVASGDNVGKEPKKMDIG